MLVEAFLYGVNAMQFVFLAIAGALGALSRYALGGVVQRMTGTGFPYGTLVVNGLGCLVIGFFMQLALTTSIISPNLRTIIAIGFLGSFTTFSTFSYETVKLLENGAFISGILNIAASVGLCLLATFCGILLAKITLGDIL
jgi:fluoride exporter